MVTNLSKKSRLKPRFHRIVELNLRYNSVKTRFQARIFWPFHDHILKNLKSVLEFLTSDFDFGLFMAIHKGCSVDLYTMGMAFFRYALRKYIVKMNLVGECNTQAHNDDRQKWYFVHTEFLVVETKSSVREICLFKKCVPSLYSSAYSCYKK